MSLPSSGSTEDNWDEFPWNHFPGYTKSQRVNKTVSWIWEYGYDIQSVGDDNNRRWVCRFCVKKRKSPPHNTSSTGTQNAEKHLFREHETWDPTGKREPPVKVKEKTPSTSIATYLKLDAHDPREQRIANSLVDNFQRTRFQQLLVSWIVDAQISFRQAENERFREMIEYLNPLVSITQAHLSHQTVRRRILEIYNSNKGYMVGLLRNVRGKINISFDGWRSRNRFSFTGIVCFFLGKDDLPQKLVLGIPEIVARHTGENIAAEVLSILRSYSIQEKIGYFTLDNASNNDTAIEEIGRALGFDGKRRRIRCFGHIINLAVKALLFGHDADAFESEITAKGTIDAARHEAWRRKGPIGKLHNFVVVIHKSDVLTQLLRKLQQDHFDRSTNPDGKRKPKDTILDNLTRWLSQLYMIRRAIELRPFLEQLWENQHQEWESLVE